MAKGCEIKDINSVKEDTYFLYSLHHLLLLSRETNTPIFVCDFVLLYWCEVGNLFLYSPLLFLRTKKTTKPTWKQACLMLLYGLLLALYHNLCLASMTLSSATFVSAINNITPVLTFVLGLAVRREGKQVEGLAYGTSAGKMKLFGIMLSMGGVMLLAFCKQIDINIPKIMNLIKTLPKNDHNNNQILGLVLAIIATFSNASFLIILAKFQEDCENIYLIPLMMNVMGTIPAGVYAVCVERDWEQWKLGWNNIRFWSAVFMGVFGSGLNITLITWCNSKMGPLFVSIFNPIGLILMALVGSLLLDEKLYVTSLVAIVLIIAATLLVLYGKLEKKGDTHTDNDDSKDSKSKDTEAEFDRNTASV